MGDYRRKLQLKYEQFVSVQAVRSEGGVLKKRKINDWYGEESRATGYFATNYELLRKYPKEMYRATRTYPEDFDYLLDLLNLDSRIAAEYPNLGMKAKERLFLTLHFLSGGTPYHDTLAITFKWREHIITSVIKDTSQALYEALQPLYGPLPKKAKELLLLKRFIRHCNRERQRLDSE